VYLGERLLYEGKEYPMVGVLPAVFGFQTKPQGHGYVKIETVRENPFFDVGESLRGHEFHYTRVESYDAEEVSFAFDVGRGFGFDGKHDGMSRYNVLASYTHVHALGTESWARAVVHAARRHKVS
jgi:cobyrinic acid a,c-diamide synthase